MDLDVEVAINFQNALYESLCQDCSTEVNWTAEFDADGTTYHGTCMCEGVFWRMRPETVLISRHKHD